MIGKVQHSTIVKPFIFRLPTPQAWIYLIDLNIRFYFKVEGHYGKQFAAPGERHQL
jgi:hypothetical protein